jgi:hypothetical protein
VVPKVAFKMKKLMSAAMVAVVLYQVAKKYGIRSLSDVKKVLVAEMRYTGKQVKHELVAG